MSPTVSIEDTILVDVETSQLCCADLFCTQIQGQLLNHHNTLAFVYVPDVDAQTYSTILVILDNS